MSIKILLSTEKRFSFAIILEFCFLLMRTIRIFFVSVITVIVLSATPSCTLFRPTVDKKAEKLQKEREKRDAKEYNKAKKEHYKNQSELTKELMKEAKKQQRKANRVHRRSLWDRLFNNNCRGGKKVK